MDEFDLPEQYRIRINMMLELAQQNIRAINNTIAALVETQTIVHNATQLMQIELALYQGMDVTVEMDDDDDDTPLQ